MPKRTRKKQPRESLLYDGGRPEPHRIIKRLIRVKTPYIDDIKNGIIKGFITFSLICIVASVVYYTIGP